MNNFFKNQEGIITSVVNWGCEDVIKKLENEDYKLQCKSNPLDNKEICILQNTKKMSYYKFTYDPQNIVKKIKNTKYGMEYLEKLDLVFDFTRRENCCNCISISLYLMKIDMALKYLLSIIQTVKNVQYMLPDWLVRIYIDTSVYNIINENKMEKKNKEIQRQALELLNFLARQPNVELYTYVCNSIVRGKIPIGRTRTFRFFPIIDENVNINIIRDADGIISYLDCHNIKIFEKSDRIFYLVPIINASDHTIDNHFSKYFAYAPWLIYYKAILRKEYFEKYNNLYDILAGTLGLKLRVEPKVYQRYNDQLQKDIDTEIGKSSFYKKNFSQEFDSKISHNIGSIVENKKKYLDMGFDEMLLLELFKDVISVPITEKDGKLIYTDEDYKKFIMSLIFANEIARFNVEDLEDLEHVIDVMISKNVFKKIDISSIKEKASSYREKGYTDFIIYLIDSLIIDKNLDEYKDKMFNIVDNVYKNMSLLELINIPIHTDNAIVVDDIYKSSFEQSEQLEQSEQSEQKEKTEQTGGKITHYYKYKYNKYKLKYLNAKI